MEVKVPQLDPLFSVFQMLSSEASGQVVIFAFNKTLNNHRPQPGRLVSGALKYTWRKRRVGGYESGNLGHIVSIATSRRVYNLEFCDYLYLRAFYNMVEAVFALKLLTI